ncbi:hypothetical protein D3C72_558100 [compost metagenome]
MERQGTSQPQADQQLQAGSAAVAQPGTEAIRQRDQQDEGQQQGHHLAAGKHAQREFELLAEPAGADEAHDDGGAQGTLPAIDGVGEQLLTHRRQHAVPERLQAAAAAEQQGTGRLQGAALHDLVVDLGQHAAVADGDGQDGGERPEPGEAHEQQRPDELGQAAQQDGDEPAEGAQGAAQRAGDGAQLGQRQGAGAEQGERNAEQQGAGQPQGRHGQALQGGGQGQGEKALIKAGWPAGGEEVAHLPPALAVEQAEPALGLLPQAEADQRQQPGQGMAPAAHQPLHGSASCSPA